MRKLPEAQNAYVLRRLAADGKMQRFKSQDQPSGSYPFTPPSTTPSMFSAISHPAAHFASSEQRYFGCGRIDRLFADGHVSRRLCHGNFVLEAGCLEARFRS
jgi:prepilin-type processing-associated H-X9-DG protein